MKKPLVDISVLIEFFVRPKMLEEVFAQVKKARPTRLFLYQDGPRDGNPSDKENIQRCRNIVCDIDWECEVKTLYQEKNFGCDPSGYIAQTWAFSHTDKCIVLEDDVVPSLSFFSFCKEMLDRYENDERIMLISGMNYDDETRNVKDDYFFSSAIILSGGWASWGRVVKKWDRNYRFLDDQSIRKRLEYLVKLNYAKNFVNQCVAHKNSGVEHFETILMANQYLNNGLSIVPSKNQVINIGLTADSTHFSANILDLPKGVRCIYRLTNHIMDTSCMNHPLWVVDNVLYRKRVFRIQGWRHPVVKVYRYFEVSLSRLFRGEFRALFYDTIDKVRKLKSKTSQL